MKISWIDAMAIIKEIRKQKYKPNEWEENFINGFEKTDTAQQKIGEYGKNCAPLTSKQGNALQNIYRKSVGGGIYQGRG